VTTQDFTVALFCRVDDALFDQKKHPLAELHPSEVVTLAMLQVLRGEGPRAFYRWVQKELRALFPRLPERTRLFRLFVQFEPLCQRFLAAPTLFGVADSYGIELVHPWRERRTKREVARKGKSNHRWIVGAKLCVVTDDCGRVVSLDVKGANVHDTHFHPLLREVEKEMIVLADRGFKARKDNPANLKVCPRGQWNERMIVETLFSLFTTVLGLKKLSHRLLAPLKARLSYTCAVCNLCFDWNEKTQLQLADFKL
jgi:hypothetical protein